MTETPRTIRWSSPQDPKCWEPNTKFDDSVVITCISNGDAKKAEELFNGLLSELAVAQAQIEAALSDAATRMDRARDILSPDKKEWAMLDTSAIRALIEPAAEQDTVTSHSDTGQIGSPAPAAAPTITDNEGRPMTYWGGKAADAADQTPIPRMTKAAQEGQAIEEGCHLERELAVARAQIAALEQKRREDVRKCEEIASGPVIKSRIRAAFPDVFKENDNS